MSMISASHEDAQLILRLYELRREEKMREAREWYGKSFSPRSIDDLKALFSTPGQENAYFRMVVSYWDMAASFIVHGVLNGELFLESGNEMLYVWAKIEPLIPQIREVIGLPSFLSNIEQAIEIIPGAPDRVHFLRERIERSKLSSTE